MLERERHQLHMADMTLEEDGEMQGEIFHLDLSPQSIGKDCTHCWMEQIC